MLLVTVAMGMTGAAEPADKTLSPYFVVENADQGLDKLPLKDTRVDVAISGVIADVTVWQVYENRGQRPIHARYVFPASTRAAVYGMTMTVGNERIVAKIKEREKAKAEFESAKREGKSASLLEQSRPNVFTMSVANVMPGDTISVELKYTELLVPVEGVYEFVFPTVVGPRYSEKPERTAPAEDRFVKSAYTHEGQAPTSEFHLSGTLSAGMPIQELSSPSHAIAPRISASGDAELKLADSEQFSGNRDFILRYRLAGKQIGSGLLLHRGNGENFFLLMTQPPEAVKAENLPPREYIFVVDVSGSMHGFPLDTAKKLMTDLINGLRPLDTFNIVVFADGSEKLSPASVPANRTNLARGLEFLDVKHGGGGTRLLSALKDACAIPVQPAMSRTVVLLTDGYVDAEREVFDYVRSQLHSTNFFAFGIGSSVNRFLIEGIARAGLGEPFVVTDPRQAEAVASRFRRYIESPVLTGIDVKFAGFDAYDVEPKNIPDLFASRPIVVFGKWRGTPGGSVQITGRTGNERYASTLRVADADALGGHAALQHLWARTRIANLSDHGGPQEDQETVAEVTALGLKYNLLTRYTSFIAVHELLRNAGAGDDVDQPLPMPAGVSDSAVGVTAGPEPELVWMVAIGLVLVVLLRCRRGVA